MKVVFHISDSLSQNRRSTFKLSQTVILVLSYLFFLLFKQRVKPAQRQRRVIPKHFHPEVCVCVCVCDREITLNERVLLHSVMSVFMVSRGGLVSSSACERLSGWKIKMNYVSASLGGAHMCFMYTRNCITHCVGYKHTHTELNEEDKNNSDAAGRTQTLRASDSNLCWVVTTSTKSTELWNTKFFFCCDLNC